MTGHSIVVLNKLSFETCELVDTALRFAEKTLFFTVLTVFFSQFVLFSGVFTALHFKCTTPPPRLSGG